MDIREQMIAIARNARKAGRRIANASPAAKDKALTRLAELLRERSDFIAEANAKDIRAAEERGLDAPRVDRLRLTPARIEDMAAACLEVAAQNDPVGEIESMMQRPNGLLVGRMRIPLGVVAIIYESRPNVTVDSAILCIKAGNAVILRGGSEAFHSNTALASLLQEAMGEADLPGDAVQLVPTTDRAAVQEMLKLEEYIDVVIPRGGEGLIRAVVADATMPVLKHYKGVCHVYVDKDADLSEALEIVFNGKVQRCGVCNALECLLVHREVSAAFLPMVSERLGSAGASFRACPKSLPLMGAAAQAASDEDWGYEFHDLILAVKTVTSQDEAQDHIAAYGSNHTEVICTRDHNSGMRFIREVDASMVGLNASTRFNDGGQLGLGAEMGISTSKLHAYGPMGVQELTSTKFVVFGKGQVRE